MEATCEIERDNSLFLNYPCLYSAFHKDCQKCDFYQEKPYYKNSALLDNSKRKIISFPFLSNSS